MRKAISTEHDPAFVSIGAVVYYFTGLSNELQLLAQNLQSDRAIPKPRFSLLNSKVRNKVLIAAFIDCFLKKYRATFPLTLAALENHIQKDWSAVI